MYPRWAGILKQMATKLKASYQPKDDLWSAAEVALWQANIAPSSLYSPLAYTIAYRGMIGWLRQDDQSYIPPAGLANDSWVITTPNKIGSVNKNRNK